MSTWEPVRPAYFTLPLLSPERKPPSDWLAGAERLWGSVELRLTVDPASGLHVGSGAPRAVGGALAAAQAGVPRIRDRGLSEVPVVPGSSLKGAVRAVVEALTLSCDPLGPDHCGRGRTSGPEWVCPACLLFGCAGRRGLVGFADATPIGDEPVALQLEEIPQRYSHQHAPRRGRRLYRPEPESPEPRYTERLERLELLPGGTVLAARLLLDGAPDWGAGVIAIALGVGNDGLPHLRLGAGKNRGLGIVRCSVTGGSHAASLTSAVGSGRPVDDRTIRRWQAAAVGRHAQLAQRRAEIRAGYGG